MTGYADFYIDQGASFAYTITLTDDLSNTAINIATYSFSGMLRRSPYSANVAANLGVSLIDSANGRLNISLTTGQTANLEGRYCYDFKSNVNNIIDRVLQGNFYVDPAATR